LCNWLCKHCGLCKPIAIPPGLTCRVVLQSELTRSKQALPEGTMCELRLQVTAILIPLLRPTSHGRELAGTMSRRSQLVTPGRPRPLDTCRSICRAVPSFPLNFAVNSQLISYLCPCVVCNVMEFTAFTWLMAAILSTACHQCRGRRIRAARSGQASLGASGVPGRRAFVAGGPFVAPVLCCTQRPLQGTICFVMPTAQNPT
jgi:hypothetical protein